MKNVTYINAGAGSGKTFTLTDILVKKLGGMNGTAQSAVLPSQVLLTTFTELAAAEFREKARQRMLEKGFLDVAAQIDSAYIGTVHSIALRFIKKFWYLLDYGADVKIISERDEDFYMSQSLSRIVSERDAAGKQKKKDELAAFRKFRDYYDIVNGYGHPDYLFWQRVLNDVVEKMEYYDVNDITESIDKSVATLRTVFKGAAITTEKTADLLAYVEKYYDYIQGSSTAAAIEQRALLEPLLKHCTDARELVAPTAKMVSNPVGGGKSIETKCPGHTEFVDGIKGLSVSADQLDVLEPYVRAIFTLAKEWRDDYVAYKKQNHIISYNDMERIFLHLITHKEEVKEYVRNNFRLIMVDEFQDSNPIQLKIFNQLSELIAPKEGHSYWVGDPKQAIYGFRGADTDLVNAVAKHFTFYDDAEIHPEAGSNNLGSGRLEESWRSRATLVELVNAVFQDKFQHTDENGQVIHDIDPLCITLKPHFQEDNLDFPALKHWNNEKKGNQTKVKADALACKVKELLASKQLVHAGKLDQAATPIRPKDVAVLCRKNASIKDIVAAMRKYGVPVSESEDAIMQRIEVQLVVTLLQFVQDASNKHVIADLMRLLWGKQTTEILRERIDYVWAKDANGNYAHLDENSKLKEDDWREEAAEVQQLLHQIEGFKHLSIPEMVKALIYECNLPALTARWGDQHIRKQNLSTVLQLANDYDQMCLQMGLGTSISGFIYYLNSVEPDREKDNQSDTVKVFTYHGAKGLEWPVVIMNELNEDALSDSELIKKSFMRVREVVADDNAPQGNPFAKTYYLHLFPKIVKDGMTKIDDTLVDKIKNLALFGLLKQQKEGEEKRLLYVGMTRAKDCLITTSVGDSFTWLKNVGITNANAGNPWGLPEFSCSVQEITSPSEQEIAECAETYAMEEKPTSHTAYGARFLSPSKIASFERFSSHTAWGEHGVDIDTRGWGSDYATIGTCIHDIFAAYHRGEAAKNDTAAVSIIGGYGVTKQLMGHKDAIFAAVDWLYSVLQNHFPQKEGDAVEREVPFQMTLDDGHTLRGEIDLIWHYTDDDGAKRAVLVDYKSFQGVDLNAHTKTHYAQLSAYAAALEKAGLDLTHALVYYPVRGVIHKLD